MELWDAYKKDGTLAGCDIRRGSLIPAGLFHTVCEILVKHIDGSYLLMQRDWNKEGYPGLFEASAGGSVLKGETAFLGALRELKEETGIESDDWTMVYAQNDMKHTFYFGYLCVTDCAKDSVVLQKNETISYRWVSEDDFLKFINGSDCIQSQAKRWRPFLDKIVGRPLC